MYIVPFNVSLEKTNLIQTDRKHVNGCLGLERVREWTMEDMESGTRDVGGDEHVLSQLC